MRVAFPSGTRSTPLDRNPATVLQSGSVSATAGQDNLVASYTVPAARRFDGNIQAAGVITTALVAAQAGDNRLVLNAANLYDQQAQPAAPVGTRVDSPSIRLQLKAGDVASIRVVAGAGAGQIAVVGSIQGVEYDA
jgi:hypothetical protein